jgi:hypothetical protein
MENEPVSNHRPLLGILTFQVLLKEVMRKIIFTFDILLFGVWPLHIKLRLT